MQAAAKRRSAGAWGSRLFLASALACGVSCSPSTSNPSRDPAAADASPTAADADAAEPVPAASADEGDDAKTPTATDEAAATAPAKPAYTPKPEDVIEPHQALENPEALAYFFDALARVDDGEKEVVRVVHLGASLIGNDDMPSAIRERFQKRFGDGGAGMVLMSRYMPNYRHRWVRQDASGWEHCFLAYLCMKDGHYGLGGTTFWSTGGATTTLRTRDDELGDEVSHFELWYLARPGGGHLEVKVDDGEPQVVDTRAEELEDRYLPIDVEQGPHKIRVRATGHGNSRAYGIVMETEGPGVVWDQFSKLGVFTKRVLAWDKEHLGDQIKHRDPALIVLTYGGNDTRRIANGKIDGDDYAEELRQVVDHVRYGKPEASCLIMSIIDKGKSLNFDIEPEHVEAIVEAQRRVALEKGCGFFDLYHAMGGGGSLKKWKKMSPPLAAPDLKHLSHRGYVLVGGWIYDALVAAYVEHRKAGGAPA